MLCNYCICTLTIFDYLRYGHISEISVNIIGKKVYHPLSIVWWCTKHCLHRSHFQAKQLSDGQRNKFAWKTWTWCEIRVEKCFAIMGNCKLHGLKWLKFCQEFIMVTALLEPRSVSSLYVDLLLWCCIFALFKYYLN